MDYEINPGTFLLPVGEGQYGVFQYLNSRGWPILEPGGRPLDDFILSHDVALSDQFRLNYFKAPDVYCDEGGCNIWGTIPAWQSVNYVRSINEGARSEVFLTAEEVALLTSIGHQAPPTEYEYGPPLAPFAPIFTAPGPIRFPPIVEPIPEPEPLFPVQTTTPGPGNFAPPVTPAAPGPAPLVLTPADTPNLGPAPGAAIAGRLALAALAALLLR